MTCSHWKNQMTTPSSSPRFSGQSDQITIGGRPVPFQSGVLPEDFAQRISRLKSASGLTWNGFALALGVDRRQVNRWREGTEPAGVPKHFYYSYELTYPPFLLPLPAPQVCFPHAELHHAPREHRLDTILLGQRAHGAGHGIPPGHHECPTENSSSRS